MTQYKKKNISGDAAEYFAAYTVTKFLNWPCRLYGVDLGVDAEMEIIDNKYKSDGDIIKMQIKGIASMPKAGKSIYVSKEHIAYWQRFSAPVIVCCVDHSRQKVYWKPITSTEAYKSGGKRNKVTFLPTDDVLDAAAKPMLQQLVTPPAAKNFITDMDAVRAYETLHSGATDGYMDDESIDADEAQANRIDALISDLEQRAFNFPWRISLADRIAMGKVRNLARHIRNQCGIARNNLTNGM